MSGRQETIADIVAEKRTQADRIERVAAAKMASGKMTSDHFAREVVATLRTEADRLEAAAKRESGNAAAMREALVDLVYVIDMFDGGHPLWWHNNARGVMSLTKARAALSAPPRNCDILDWRKAWDLWITEKHPQKPQTFNEAYKGTVSFMDWYMSKSEKEGENYGK